MSLVVLYSRPGCHLCEQARDTILSLRDGGAPLELREVDIDRDDELQARFMERIPVVELDGEIVAELHLDPEVLRLALAARRTGTVRPVTREAETERR